MSQTIKRVVVGLIAFGLAGCSLIPSKPKPLDFVISEPGLVSPEGNELYLSGAGHIWKLTQPMGSPEQLTSGTASERVLDVTSDGKNLILERKTRDEESTGLYFMPSRGGEPVTILHELDVRTIYGASTVDGRRVYFLANDRDPKSFSLYQFDLETRQKELLHSLPGDWFIADVAGDLRFLLGKTKGPHANEFFVWSLEKRELVPVVGQGTYEEYDVRFGREADEFVFLSAAGTGTKTLFRLRQGQLEKLPLAEDAEPTGIVTDMRHSLFYISWVDTGRTRWEVRDGASLETVRVESFPFADSVRLGRPSRFGRYIGILTEDAAPVRQSHQVYDWKTSKLTEWSKQSF